MSRMQELCAVWDRLLADYQDRSKKASGACGGIEARDNARLALAALGQATTAVLNQPARSVMDLGRKVDVYWQCAHDAIAQAEDFSRFEAQPGEWLSLIHEDIAMMAAEEQAAAIWLRTREPYPEMEIEEGDYVNVRAFPGFTDDGPYAVLANRKSGERYIATLGQAQVRNPDGTLRQRIRIGVCHFSRDDDKCRILSPHRVLGTLRKEDAAAGGLDHE